MPGPIKPSDVKPLQEKGIPEGVFGVFNRLIVHYWDGTSATISEKGVAQAVAVELSIPVEAVYESHYLDIEDIYTRAGWHVRYDKPGISNSYEAFFVFSEK